MGDGGYKFDEAAAAKVCNFFERYLILPESRKPYVLMDCQREWLTNIFGTKQHDGLRRYRTAYIEIPKKNAKSTFSAGLALYMLCADGEYSGEVYSVAG